MAQEWDTQYEVAWNWLWDNVAQLLATSAASKTWCLGTTRKDFSNTATECRDLPATAQVKTLRASYQWEADLRSQSETSHSNTCDDDLC